MLTGVRRRTWLPGIIMNFDIEVNGRQHAVKIERAGSRYRIESDGRVDVVDVARVDRSTMSIVVEGERDWSYEVSLTDGREPGEIEVHLRAGVVQTRVVAAGDRRRRRGGDGLGAAAGPQRVIAPMPGKIVKVLVKAGDEVAARQGLVVIEAMKMENELRAVRAGQVKDVHVVDGDLVEAGRLLTVIE
jgi:biotin carboxyl carrier protein